MKKSIVIVLITLLLGLLYISNAFAYEDATNKITMYTQCVQGTKYYNSSEVSKLQLGGGTYVGRSGCLIMSYAHAIQWLTNTKIDDLQYIKDMIKEGSKPWTVGSDYYAGLSTCDSRGIDIVNTSVSLSNIKELFDKGYVIIGHPSFQGSKNGHYNLAVGYTERDVNNDGKDELLIQMIDSSINSTYRRLIMESKNDVNKGQYALDRKKDLGYKMYDFTFHEITSEPEGNNPNVSGQYWVTANAFLEGMNKSRVVLKYTPINANKLEFRDVEFPETFHISTKGWTLAGGVLVSNVKLKSIASLIVKIEENGKETKISEVSPVSISGNRFSVKRINSSVKFSAVKEEGNYAWILTGNDENNIPVSLRMEFQAYKNKKTVIGKKSSSNVTPDQQAPQEAKPVSFNDYSILKSLENEYYRIIGNDGDLKQYPYAASETIKKMKTNLKISSLTENDVFEIKTIVGNIYEKNEPGKHQWAEVSMLSDQTKTYFKYLGHLEFLYKKICDVNFRFVCKQNDVKLFPFAEASNVRENTAGKKYYAVTRYENKYGNTWYGVAEEENGTQIGYVNENNLLTDESLIEISVNNVSIPSGDLPYGKSFHISGDIKTNTSIYGVKAFIISQTTGKVVASAACFPNPKDKKIGLDSDVRGNNINQKLKFADLPEDYYYFTVEILFGYAMGDTYVLLDGGTKTHVSELSSHFIIGNPDKPITLDPLPLPDEVTNPEFMAYELNDSVVCTITWLDDSGEVIDKTEVPYGTIPFHGAPIKESDADKKYVFSGWGPNIVAATGDATYQAIFSEASKTYTITWKKDDGTIIDTTEVEEGIIPTHSNPEKESTNELIYTFSGWEPEVVVASENTEYIAKFTASERYYEITWMDYDGTILKVNYCKYNDIPKYDGEELNTYTENDTSYIFSGWIPDVGAVTGPATYQAFFTETAEVISGKCGDNLNWTFSNGLLAISGNGEMYDYEGNGPFRNLGVTSVVIWKGATSIGNCAFQDCGMLTSISIPDTVTRIGTNAFAYTSRLESISIPDSVTYIGPGAFYECQNLKNIQLPKHLTTINDYTFYRCTSLTGINVPNEVTEIGNNAFYYCNKMTNVTLSNKLKRIGDWAFYACNSLTNITIPDSVTTIGKSAFLHSQGLTSIAIPANVTQIGDNAFAGCRKMTAINVAADNRNYCSIDGVLFNKAKTELIRYPSGRQGEYSVPEGVTTIANTAFYVTPNLTKVTLPESVTNIGRDAFSDCYNLSNATILNKTAQIGEKAFYVYLDAYEHWNDKVTVYCYADSTAHKYAIENNVKYSLLTSDPTVTEAPQTDLYFTYSGEGQDYVKTSNENKEFSVKRAVEDEKTFSLFTGIQVDGKNVDRSNYEATAGSVVIKLKAPYLETLTVGDHVMTVLFTDGKNDIPFTVSAAETPVKPTDPTKFADVAVPSNTFTFKKVWQGDHEDSIDFTLYKADGSVYHHGFDKRVVSKMEWKYNAYFSAPAACYVIEKPVPGYQIKYVNVGVYADVTDRCCDGGTIINKKVPKTGDAADFALWAGIIALGVVGLTTTVILTKRKKAHK